MQRRSHSYVGSAGGYVGGPTVQPLRYAPITNSGGPSTGYYVGSTTMPSSGPLSRTPSGAASFTPANAQHARHAYDHASGRSEASGDYYPPSHSSPRRYASPLKAPLSPRRSSAAYDGSQRFGPQSPPRVPNSRWGSPVRTAAGQRDEAHAMNTSASTFWSSRAKPVASEAFGSDEGGDASPYAALIAERMRRQQERQRSSGHHADPSGVTLEDRAVGFDQPSAMRPDRETANAVTGIAAEGRREDEESALLGGGSVGDRHQHPPSSDGRAPDAEAAVACASWASYAPPDDSCGSPRRPPTPSRLPSRVQLRAGSNNTSPARGRGGADERTAIGFSPQNADGTVRGSSAPQQATPPRAPTSRWGSPVRRHLGVELVAGAEGLAVNQHPAAVASNVTDAAPPQRPLTPEPASSATPHTVPPVARDAIAGDTPLPAPTSAAPDAAPAAASFAADAALPQSFVYTYSCASTVPVPAAPPIAVAAAPIVDGPTSLTTVYTASSCTTTTTTTTMSTACAVVPPHPESGEARSNPCTDEHAQPTTNEVAPSGATADVADSRLSQGSTPPPPLRDTMTYMYHTGHGPTAAAEAEHEGVITPPQRTSTVVVDADHPLPDAAEPTSGSDDPRFIRGLTSRVLSSRAAGSPSQGSERNDLSAPPSPPSAAVRAHVQYVGAASPQYDEASGDGADHFVFSTDASSALPPPSATLTPAATVNSTGGPRHFFTAESATETAVAAPAVPPLHLRGMGGMATPRASPDPSVSSAPPPPPSPPQRLPSRAHVLAASRTASPISPRIRVEMANSSRFEPEQSYVQPRSTVFTQNGNADADVTNHRNADPSRDVLEAEIERLRRELAEARAMGSGNAKAAQEQPCPSSHTSPSQRSSSNASNTMEEVIRMSKNVSPSPPATATAYDNDESAAIGRLRFATPHQVAAAVAGSSSAAADEGSIAPVSAISANTAATRSPPLHQAASFSRRTSPDVVAVVPDAHHPIPATANSNSIITAQNHSSLQQQQQESAGEASPYTLRKRVGRPPMDPLLLAALRAAQRREIDGFGGDDNGGGQVDGDAVDAVDALCAAAADRRLAKGTADQFAAPLSHVLAAHHCAIEVEAEAYQKPTDHPSAVALPFGAEEGSAVVSGSVIAVRRYATSAGTDGAATAANVRAEGVQHVYPQRYTVRSEGVAQEAAKRPLVTDDEGIGGQKQSSATAQAGPPPTFIPAATNTHFSAAAVSNQTHFSSLEGAYAHRVNSGLGNARHFGSEAAAEGVRHRASVGTDTRNRPEGTSRSASVAEVRVTPAHANVYGDRADERPRHTAAMNYAAGRDEDALSYAIATGRQSIGLHQRQSLGTQRFQEEATPAYARNVSALRQQFASQGYLGGGGAQAAAPLHASDTAFAWEYERRHGGLQTLGSNVTATVSAAGPRIAATEATAVEMSPVHDRRGHRHQNRSAAPFPLAAASADDAVRQYLRANVNAVPASKPSGQASSSAASSLNASSVSGPVAVLHPKGLHILPADALVDNGNGSFTQPSAVPYGGHSQQSYPEFGDRSAAMHYGGKAHPHHAHPERFADTAVSQARTYRNEAALRAEMAAGSYGRLNNPTPIQHGYVRPAAAPTGGAAPSAGYLAAESSSVFGHRGADESRHNFTAASGQQWGDTLSQQHAEHGGHSIGGGFSPQHFFRGAHESYFAPNRNPPSHVGPNPEGLYASPTRVKPMRVFATPEERQRLAATEGAGGAYAPLLARSGILGVTPAIGGSHLWPSQLPGGHHSSHEGAAYAAATHRQYGTY